MDNTATTTTGGCVGDHGPTVDTSDGTVPTGAVPAIGART